jgi:hypothetical protein
MNDLERSSNPGIEIVAAVGREFDRIEREQTGGWSRGGSLRRGRRAGAVALVGGLLAVGAAGAATGMLSVGTVIPSGGDPDFRHDRPSPEQTVVATGATPVGGAWRMTTYTSEGLVDSMGEVAEPAGMPCALMTFINPPAGTHSRSGALCHAPGKADFNMTSLPVVDASSGEAEVVLYGFAPKDSTHVELVGDGSESIHVPTVLARGPSPGDLWVIAAPPELKNAHVSWIDTTGRPRATRDASDHFDRFPAIGR